MDVVVVVVVPPLILPFLVWNETSIVIQSHSFGGLFHGLTTPTTLVTSDNKVSWLVTTSIPKTAKHLPIRTINGYR